MNLQNLVNQKKAQLKARQYIEFTDDEITALNLNLIQDLISRLDGCCLMKLPAAEVAFFDWLRKEEPTVWEDLWGEEDDEYLVSINFLKQLLNKTSGFSICDLQQEDNFWFCGQHLKPKARDLIPQILDKIQNKQKLKLHEAFFSGGTFISYRYMAFRLSL